jgi:SOS response regulatory protein OraA/RecX
MDSLAEVDWVENCAAAIRKKYCVIPEDRGARQKLMAAVLRLGYDSETIKDALRSVLRNG